MLAGSVDNRCDSKAEPDSTVFAYHFESVRYDVREEFGLIKITIVMALKAKELKDKLDERLSELRVISY